MNEEAQHSIITEKQNMFIDDEPSQSATQSDEQPKKKQRPNFDEFDSNEIDDEMVDLLDSISNAKTATK